MSRCHLEEVSFTPELTATIQLFQRVDRAAHVDHFYGVTGEGRGLYGLYSSLYTPLYLR